MQTKITKKEMQRDAKKMAQVNIPIMLRTGASITKGSDHVIALPQTPTAGDGCQFSNDQALQFWQCGPYCRQTLHKHTLLTHMHTLTRTFVPHTCTHLHAPLTHTHARTHARTVTQDTR